jgi:hypothetical protein
MKNYIKYFFVGILLFLIGVAIWKTIQDEKKYQYFKKVKLNSLNHIINRTNIDYLDTVISVGLNKLDIRGITLIIYPLKEETKKIFAENDFELKAYIRGVNKQYIIWIDKMDKLKTINTLSHELIHLKQYETNRLIVNDKVVIWKGEKIDLMNVPYSERPWEIEAFEKETDLNILIRKELFE